VFLKPKIVQPYFGSNMPKELLDRYENTTVEIKPERSLQEKSPSQDMQDKQYPSKQKNDEEYKKKWEELVKSKQPEPEKAGVRETS